MKYNELSPHFRRIIAERHPSPELRRQVASLERDTELLTKLAAEIREPLTPETTPADPHDEALRQLREMFPTSGERG